MVPTCWKFWKGIPKYSPKSKFLFALPSTQTVLTTRSRAVGTECWHSLLEGYSAVSPRRQGSCPLLCPGLFPPPTSQRLRSSRTFLPLGVGWHLRWGLEQEPKVFSTYWKNPLFCWLTYWGFDLLWGFVLSFLWLWKWQVLRKCACESAGGWKDVAGEEPGGGWWW